MSEAVLHDTDLTGAVMIDTNLTGTFQSSSAFGYYVADIQETLTNVDRAPADPNSLLNDYSKDEIDEDFW